MAAIRRRWESGNKKGRFGESQNHGNSNSIGGSNIDLDDSGEAMTARRFEGIEERDAIDAQMGFGRMISGPARLGWMTNMRSTLVKDAEWPGGRSAIDYYFLQDDGDRFKVTLPSSPYFYAKCCEGREGEVEEWLRRKFGATIESVERCTREDLEMPNHVSGKQALYLKLSFRNTFDLVKVRNAIAPRSHSGSNSTSAMSVTTVNASPGGYVLDVREHDVPYHLRVAIDRDIRCGVWYSVTAAGQGVTLERIKGKDSRPDPTVLAFDIETSKKPLKFPDASDDPIMMISYMVDGRGFLVTNRDILSKDLDDFEYTPLPEYKGKFRIFNEPSEAAMLNKFFSHIQQIRPLIIVSYNGDNFDWPYVEKRASLYGMSIAELVGVRKTLLGGGSDGDSEYTFSYGTHMDCFCWVKRDSYLPAGSQGLKAVSKAKLGYNPIELDPEEMTPLARSDPQTLANYSVSDAVATYYLYMKYVNPFIFSLCTLIPLTPDEVLRKGSGTLCETLLMAEAFKAKVIYPNKHVQEREQFWNGHLLDGETYVGGHVESLEAGVFRSDLSYKFKVCPDTVGQLVGDLERALTFFLGNEGVRDLSQVTNYGTVYGDIKGRLDGLKATPSLTDRPLIYHLDVGAMYPNIILTNRLQPPALVTEADCAVCDYNVPGKNCQRPMTWTWRGEFYTANKGEYRMIKGQLERERFTLKRSSGQPSLAFHELTPAEQQALLSKRLAEYSQTVYKRTKQTEEVHRTSIVCMRENSFYVDTVRSFRDHRYTYKSLCKVWKKKLDEAVRSGDPAAIEGAEKMHIVYDSLQLAHKCILNSFYGYVMRKGARWFSMEMGGIVCETGGQIIRLARGLIDKIGRPLELDTDGIWLMLPWEFPQNYTFELADGRKLSCAYPCVMLNHLVHDQFTNHQYQTLVSREQPHHEFKTHSENSIFFEIDGPYRAMIMPSSTEEGKQLKKRYAVFNKDGSVAELKGFEVKRRGELNLIKIFQTQLFKTYLEGATLTECYSAVAEVANYWLDVLDTQGVHITDHELFDLLSENRSMSKALGEYEGQKSTSISTAKRLAEFLGDEMVRDRGGLACQFIISAQPHGDPVNTRAIPVAIWSAQPEVRKHYLRAWLKDHSRTDFDIRSIIDWAYYRERFGSTVQKLIIIPAALQGIPNPVARVPPPDWLARRIATLTSKSRQMKITEIFSPSQSSLPLGLAAVGAGDGLAPEPIVACPPLETDYVGWLEHQKKFVWMAGQVAKTKKGSKLDGFVIPFDAKQDPDRPWHILDIAESPSQLGCFVVSALVGGQIKRLNIRHPRRLFVHCHEPIEGINFPVSNCRLAHCPKETLYDLVVGDEETYRQLLPNLHTSIFTHPNVEGVYEADLEQPQRDMLLSYGSVIRPLIRAVKTYSTDQLAPCPEVLYLDDPIVAYAFIYVAKTDTRSVWSVFTSDSCNVYVVDPFGKRQMGNARNVLQQSGGCTLFTSPEAPVNVSYVSDEQPVLISLSSAFSKPTIAFANADLGPVNSCHVIVVSVEQFVLGPLDWQRGAFRRACEEASRWGVVAADAIRLARYSRLPLTFVVKNVINDPEQSIVLADIFLSRTLKANGYVIPKQSESFESLPIRTSFNRKGLYQKTCIDLDITGLAVDSVLEFSRLLDDPNAGTDQSAPPPLALSILKSLLTTWLREAISPNNPYVKESEAMVAAFHRWIVSSDVMPAEWKELLGCAMARCVNLLTDHVANKCGAEVIACDANRLVLMTPRDRRENAEAFLEWLVKDTQGRECFSWLRFTPRNYYGVLLWHSDKDYVGVVSDPSGDGKEVVDVRLSLIEHLPPVLRKPFHQAIALYLLAACRRATVEVVATCAAPYTANPSSLTHGSGLGEEEMEGEEMPMDLKEKLINIVVSISKGYSAAHHSLPPEMLFPKCIGSERQTAYGQEGAAFVFCKFLHGLLSVDTPSMSASLFKTLDKALLISGNSKTGFDASFDFEYPVPKTVIDSLAVDEYCCGACNTVYCLDLLRGPPRCLCGSPVELARVEGALIKKYHKSVLLDAACDRHCDSCGTARIGCLQTKCTVCPNGRYRAMHASFALGPARQLAKAYGLNVLASLVQDAD